MRAFIRTVFVGCLLLGLSAAFAGLGRPAGAAAESALKIYVVNLLQDKVLIFSGSSDGNISPLGTIAGGETKLNEPEAVAFDAQGNLYVLNRGFMGSVTVYAPGASGDAHPLRTIAGFSTGLKNGPESLAVDGAGNVYASESLDVSAINAPGAKTIYSDSLLVFPPGADGDANPIRTIKGSATRMDGIRGLALDKAGNLYVANTGERINGREVGMRVTVYAPGADGNAAPIRTIEGPNTGLYRPFFLALDKAGNLYVANLAGSTGGVTTVVFAPGASGDARPVRTLQGPRMHGAGDLGDAVAVDGAGDVYMNDLDGPAVQVYPPGAGGNAPAIRTIKGSNTQLRSPRFVAVWPMGPAARVTAGETTPAAPSSGRVTAVRRVGVRPGPEYKGPYPAKFEFVFSITTDGPAEVKYVLVNQADRAWDSGALSFDGAETKELVLPVKVGVPPGKHFEGWTKLEVYVPNKMESEEVPISADVRP
jgi:hypothetical protein